jgi:glutaconate CoA-transferase subunit A
MAEILDLASAVAELVHDGDCVALEGFTHLIPFAAAHEIIRQGRRDLTLARLTPDLVFDQMIGMGCAPCPHFFVGGATRVSGPCTACGTPSSTGGRLPSALMSTATPGSPTAMSPGASALPFAVMRGYVGTDLMARSPTISTVDCPFTGETLAAVQALRPDVAVVHAQQADRQGNVQLWGITGVQKEAVLASQRSLVTVEEIVDELVPKPGGVVLPSWVVTAVAPAPGGARPSYSLGYYQRDNDLYVAWDAISRQRDTFLAWMRQEVLA